MTTQSLTKKQKVVLDFIRGWYSRKGYPPTVREIASSIGVRSTNAVHNYLKILYRKGYLDREDMKSRTWRPVDAGEAAATVSVPVVGRIAAGSPLLVEENLLGAVRVDASMVGGGEGTFALQVAGDSMVEAGILDGDIVFVNPHLPITPGDVVVAMIGGEATVKYYFRDKNAVRLQPANRAMAPIYLAPDRGSQVETQVTGKVTGVYRKLA